MKTKIIAIFMSVVTVLSLISVVAYAQSLVAGDVSGDGKVTASDARKVLRVAAGLDVLEEGKMIVADITGDGKITASDARKILRAAAGLETLPEITTEPESEETSTEETTAEEPSSEEEKPSEEETTTANVVTEYPKVISAFFEGRFYLECDMSSDDSSSTIKLAKKDKKMEASMTMDGFEMSIYTDGKSIFIKFPYNKQTYYIEMKKETLEEMGIDLDIESIAEQLTFGTADDYSDPILTREEYNGEEYDVYSFVDKDGYSLCFYVDEEEDVKYIFSKDPEGQTATEIKVAVLSSSIPSTMLSVRKCKEGSVMTLMLALEAFGNQQNK